MAPSDLIDDLRGRINPAYAAQLGTESYERRLCAEAMEALLAENDEYRELLRELLVQLCENPGIREDGNAPGHAHEVSGVWDDDNDELAGKPCAWCAVWARAVANGLVGSNVQGEGLAACGESPRPKGYASFDDPLCPQSFASNFLPQRESTLIGGIHVHCKEPRSLSCFDVAHIPANWRAGLRCPAGLGEK